LLLTTQELFGQFLILDGEGLLSDIAADVSSSEGMSHGSYATCCDVSMHPPSISGPSVADFGPHKRA
jgi:hypothetical protein